MVLPLFTQRQRQPPPAPPNASTHPLRRERPPPWHCAAQRTGASGLTHQLGACVTGVLYANDMRRAVTTPLKQIFRISQISSQSRTPHFVQKSAVTDTRALQYMQVTSTRLDTTTGGDSFRQNRQTTASALIDSAQNGHFLVSAERAVLMNC